MSESDLNLKRLPVRQLFRLLAEGRFVPISEIKQAIYLRPDDESMSAYSRVTREVSRLRQSISAAGIRDVCIARHGSGFVMFQVKMCGG